MPTRARSVHAGSTHARFPAFGTYGHLAVRRPEALRPALRIARTVVADVDATCSRFRADSDLARVNREPGRWVEVHPLLVEAVRVAVGAAEATDGLVHPLLGRPLVTLGYDRDFRELREIETAPTLSPAPALDAWRSIELDEAAVRIPAGTALDLGSTAKAWASDVVATGLAQELGEPALVSLGGDLMISTPDGLPWRVAVAEHPADLERPECLVTLTDGGLATSSTRVRRWTRRGTVHHHVLDPRTGDAAMEVWRTVTATGPSCVAANTATTAAVVLGAAAVPWLDRHGVTARLVAADGRVHATGRWPLDAERRVS